MLDSQIISLPSLGSVVTCDGAMSTGRAMRRIPLEQFACENAQPEPEYDRRARRAFIRDYRQLARREAKRIRVHARIARFNRARTSHRVGSAKPSATVAGGDSDGEPPREPERVAVATVTPDGSPCTVVIEVDPFHIDPTAILFAARRAAGHSLNSATRGLDDLHVDVVHSYTNGGVA